jgi:Transposase DDE domain
VLSFSCLVLLILRGHKLSLQNALNKLFSALGKVFSVPTASALCQARQKLNPEIFQYLNEIVCTDFYTLSEEEEVQRWRSHRLIACDGTYLNLPDNSETRSEFFLQTNQFKQGSAVQALACVVYDLLNGLALCATLGTRTSETKPLLEEMWEKTEASDILILDRHYASYALLAWAVETGREVVVRLPRSGFKEARPLLQKGSKTEEKVVQIRCPVTSLSFVREHQLAERLTVRFIRVPLESGEIELLATTLLDANEYPTHEFKWLYGKRWLEETFFNRVKNIFEVERFSGTSPVAIKQDYYGVLFLASMESALANSDQKLLIEEAEARKLQRGRRRRAGEEDEEGDSREPQVNHAVSYLALLERVVELLMSSKSEEKILQEIHHLFRMNPTRARPGRRYDRPEEKSRRAQLLRHHKYVKKIIA